MCQGGRVAHCNCLQSSKIYGSNPYPGFYMYIEEYINGDKQRYRKRNGKGKKKDE